MDRFNTFSNTAKTIFYNPNGTGRDTYIHSNHGGLSIPRMRNTQPEKGSMNCKELHMMTVSPFIHSKPVHYHSNGTGRDSYIVRSSGGLYSEYVPGSSKNAFYTGLRQYEDSRSQSPFGRSLSPRVKGTKKDVFLRSQNHFNSTHQSNFRKMKSYQRGLDNRLAIPKKIAVKQES